MPPKVKTTEEEIIEAAFEVARSEGLGAVTAKSVSEKLGTSVAPIFRVFSSIEELKEAVVARIHTFHLDYLMNYPFHKSKFMSYGFAYVNFAAQEPYLFDVIVQQGLYIQYIKEHKMPDSLSFIIESISELIGEDISFAIELFNHIQFYTHGIACMVYKNNVNLSEEEVERMLYTAFMSFFEYLKREKHS